MPHSEARAWWDDVQHVRETIERRRADAARSAATPDRRSAGRFDRSPNTGSTEAAWAEAPSRRRDSDDVSDTAAARPLDPENARATARGRRVERDDVPDVVPGRRVDRDDVPDVVPGGRLDRDDVPDLVPGRRFERSSHANHARADSDRPRTRGRRSDLREHWTGAERRDPNRADRRVAGHSDHHALGHPERRDPTRADRRDPARTDRRADRHADHRERRHDPAHPARRAGARDERPAAPRVAGRAARPEPAAAPRPTAGSTPMALHPPPRRTVQITGRPLTAPRLVEVERRRPVRRPVERIGGRPDRIALWAVLLCFFLILVAASS
jgi:hypothetical protein